MVDSQFKQLGVSPRENVYGSILTQSSQAIFRSKTSDARMAALIKITFLLYCLPSNIIIAFFQRSEKDQNVVKSNEKLKAIDVRSL